MADGSSPKPRPRRPDAHTLAHPSIPRDGDRIFLAGASGCGKTTLAARSLVRDVIEHGRKALVYDPTGDVRAYLLKGGAASDPIASDLVATVASPEDARRALARGGLTSWFARSPVRVLCVSVSRSLDYAAAAKLWLELADSDARRGWVLFADEADTIFPVSLSPKGPALRVLGLTRNRRQRLYATCNYPAMSAPRLRALSAHACVFTLTNHESVRACSWFGEWEWYERALALPKFSYLYRGPGGVDPLPVLDARSGAIPW